MSDDLAVQMFAIRRAAEARWQVIERERTELLRWFPDLALVADVVQFPTKAKGRKPASQLKALERLWKARPALPPAPAEKNVTPPTRKPRQTMTRAQRKAVSLRMKKYWAGRRKDDKLKQIDARQ
jgi:hypothetical protein